MKCFAIGYTAKGGVSEFSACYGLKLRDKPLPSMGEIRESCLRWANAEGGNYNYIQINFITQLDEEDYDSFMEVNKAP